MILVRGREGSRRALSRSDPVLSRQALELFRAEQHPLTHDLSGLELHGRTRGDRYIDFGLVGIATDAGASKAHLEHSEIPQFYPFTFGQCVGDMVQSLLDDVEDVALNETCFVADGDNEVAFGKIGLVEKGRKRRLIW